MLCRVVLVRPDVSGEHITSIIRVTRIVRTAKIVPSSPILATLMKEAILSSEMSVHTRAAQHHIKAFK
jgi:hypothetical protein